MNTFFNYIQPTIVRASFDEGVPEHLRGRFFINFNVFGIKYFEERYILTENSNNFQYLLLKENSGIFMLEDTLESEDIVDVPRIYIDITDEFVNDRTNMFKSFVYQASLDNAIWGQGIDGFLAGQQFYVNSTLYNYLAVTNQLTNLDLTIRLNNYLDESAHITKYWMDLSNEPYKDYHDLDYFNEKNKILDFEYSEDELNNFYSNFCKIILKYTKISSEMASTGNNNVYNYVLNYYANFMNDAGTNAIAMILNTLYSNSAKTGCGCSTKFVQDTTPVTMSCFDMYKTGMFEWLKKMLGDKTFYEDWFRMDIGNGKPIPNDVLVSRLDVFIKEFMALKNMLVFTKTTNKLNCNCPSVTVDENDCNYGILENYLKLLGFVKDDAIEANKNKIKIFGTTFAEILPKLQF